MTGFDNKEQQESFIKAMVADPCNYQLVLEYADWLENHGQNADTLRQPGSLLLCVLNETRTGDDPSLIWSAKGKAQVIGVIPFRKWPKCNFGGHLGKCTNVAHVAMSGKWFCCVSCIGSARLAIADKLIRKMHPEIKQCPVCYKYTEKNLVGDGCCENCHDDGWVIGRRGWRQLGVYDG